MLFIMLGHLLVRVRREEVPSVRDQAAHQLRIHEHVDAVPSQIYSDVVSLPVAQDIVNSLARRAEVVVQAVKIGLSEGGGAVVERV